jgi:hypothetical protein
MEAQEKYGNTSKIIKIELYTLLLGDNSYPLGAYQFGSHYCSGRRNIIPNYQNIHSPNINNTTQKQSNVKRLPNLQFHSNKKYVHRF